MAKTYGKQAGKAKTGTFYLCTIEWDWELGENIKTTLYTSLAALKKDHRCWKQCGVVKIKGRFVLDKRICLMKPFAGGKATSNALKKLKVKA